jgi:chromosome segregation ATPase
MSNEEKILSVLQQLVEKVDKLDQRMDAFEKRMDSIEKRMDSIEKRIDCLEKESKKQSARIDELEIKVDKIIEKLEALSQDVWDIHTRQKENSDIIAALLKGTEIAKAENDGFRLKMAEIEGEHVVIKRKLHLLQQMSADVMSDMSRMKAAQ